VSRRRRWLTGCWLAAAAVVLLFLVVTYVVPHKPLANGTAAPGIALTAVDGARVDVLAHIRDTGRGAVVEFFESSCPDCKRTVPALCDLARSRPADVFAVNATGDSAEDVRNFGAANGGGCLQQLKVPLLLDPASETAHAYRIWEVPTLYVIDAQGRVAWSGDSAAAAGQALSGLKR
jgi:thiol-disulfide isomerase/thioredoxin